MRFVLVPIIHVNRRYTQTLQQLLSTEDEYESCVSDALHSVCREDVKV